MRHAERVRQGARAANRLRRAARLRPVGALVRPELQRHRDDLRPALALEQRGHGRVDPAARSQPGPAPARPAPPQARSPDDAADDSARPSASPTSSAACRPCGVSPPTSSATRSVPIAATASTGAPAAASQAAAAQAPSAAQPSASKVASWIRPSRISNERRTRSPQTEPPALPSCAPAGEGPRRAVVTREFIEELAIHASEGTRAGGPSASPGGTGGSCPCKGRR